MATWNVRQRRLLVVVIVSLVIIVGDIIAATVAGDLSSLWWALAFFGLLLVSAIGIASFVWLLWERRAAWMPGISRRGAPH
jgi:hypothetical protein